MSALPTRTYRVCLHTWEVYDIIVEAIDGAEAQALYEKHGLEAFDHLNSGDDGCNVLEEVQ